MHKVAQRSSREKEWKPSWRESLCAQMLGVLSVALGLVALMKIHVIWFGFSSVAESIDVWLSPPRKARPLHVEAGCVVQALLRARRRRPIPRNGRRLARHADETLQLPAVDDRDRGICVIAILPMYLMLIVSSLVIVVPLLLPALAAMAINQYAKQR